MDEQVLVKIEGVSKKFCRSLKQSLWYGVKDIVSELNPFPGQNSRSEALGLREGEFWAVSEVSFELRRGECLGLIGRNGAGKTTLLKMINGLIKPDAGRIEMHGRVGALIALGAGFNPILTGRENIYINASVLGLSKKETDARMEEIISFADIDDFIDAPVQTYSSGMQVRLGFAVATALSPDILILDEVLAVGDAAFRAKCYHRVAEIADRAAIILVSHSMEQIGQVCHRIAAMKNGRAQLFSDVSEGINFYNQLNEGAAFFPGTEHVSETALLSLEDVPKVIAYGQNLEISFKVDQCPPISMLDTKIVLWAANETCAFNAYTKTHHSCLALSETKGRIRVKCGPIFLKNGKYLLSVALINRANNEHIYWGDRIRQISATDGPSHGLGSYQGNISSTYESCLE